MESQASKKPSKAEAEKFARTFGFGIPDLGRALNSARDALTFICEDELSPYDQKSYGFMNLHDLPWPIQELKRIGSEKVKLRATLSYFIDPYPVRKEGERQARYASAHLRFELKRALEDPASFLKRINEKEVNADRPRAPKEPGDWFLGPEARHAGSLHHDIWSGTAAELADKVVLAVTPVAGWMRDEQNNGLGGIGSAMYSSSQSKPLLLTWTCGPKWINR